MATVINIRTMAEESEFLQVALDKMGSRVYTYTMNPVYSDSEFYLGSAVSKKEERVLLQFDFVITLAKSEDAFELGTKFQSEKLKKQLYE